jgi:hypothetical protein
MATFYGTVQGSRGEASRLGTRKSGLRAVAASWQGAVEVALEDHDGEIWAEVALRQWNGAGVFPPVELYSGPVSRFEGKTAALKDALLQLHQAVQPIRLGERNGAVFGLLSLADDRARALLE